MEIFRQRDTEVYIPDYQHLGVYACRILVPGMSDIYLAEDLLLNNNAMAIDLCVPLCKLPASLWPQADYLALIQQIDALGPDDFARVRELLGLATVRDNGWFTLRVGELKAMLALARRRPRAGAVMGRMDAGLQCIGIQPKTRKLLPLPTDAAAVAR